MKKILFAILILVSAAAQAQTTFPITGSPQTITITDTNTNIIDLPKGRFVEIWVRFPSANIGTVQINTEGSDMTTATVMNATTHPQGIWIKAREKFYIKVSSANDKIDVIVYK
jgi:hypothetical protein